MELQLTDEPAKTYHEKGKEWTGSHGLKDYRTCPLMFRLKQLGLIKSPFNPSYFVGSATHTLILEGEEKFKAEYAVGGPINPKTQKCYGTDTKAFAEWADTQGKPVIDQESCNMIRAMRQAVMEHDAAPKLLKQGRAEGVVRAVVRGVKVQIRCDWFHHSIGIVDLKTCADLDEFRWDIKKFGYVDQAAFYQMVAGMTSEIRYPFHLIAVEKKEPFRVGVWAINDDSLDKATSENLDALDRLAYSQSHDFWPKGYEGIQVYTA